MIFYGLAEHTKVVRLTIMDDEGREVRVFDSTVDEKVSTFAGMNRLVWELTYPGADVISGSRLDGYIGGPRAVPGTFQVRLDVGARSQAKSFSVLMDPRSESTLTELQEQFDFLMKLRDSITRTHDAVRTIHSIRDEIKEAESEVAQARPDTGSRTLVRRVTDLSSAIRRQLDELEDRLRQKRAKVWQDTASFEPLLDDQVAWLASYTMSADTRPTESAYDRYHDLTAELSVQLDRLDTIVRKDVSSLRATLHEWENR
jgi:hypothetical protein